MLNGFAKATSILCVAALTLGFAASEHDEHLCAGFVPENNLKIPVGTRYQTSFRSLGGGLTEAQFNAVIDRFERIYASDFSKAGGTLRLIRKWSDGTVNAYANRSGSTWMVNMFGGLARHPAITEEGFALVVCHEGGHHIGGAPKLSSYFSNWGTNEGGADYFAGLKCLRRMFAEDDNAAIIAAANIDPLARERCTSEFTTEADQLLCMRTSLAGDSVAKLFMDLRKEKTPPNLANPDPAQVSRTDDAHPATQCRMDTYFAGATCHVNWTIPVSDKDIREGACIQGVDPVGWRPRCWFKP
jgi:hypothetical protein